MATLKTDKAAAGVQPRAREGIEVVYAEYELSAALTLNDVIQMCKVPRNAVIVGMSIETDALDSGGSETLVLDVGDGDNTDRFFDGLTIGQGGGKAELMADGAAGGFLHEYAAEDTIDVLVQVAPAAGKTEGSIKMAVFYTLSNA